MFGDDPSMETFTIYPGVRKGRNTGPSLFNIFKNTYMNNYDIAIHIWVKKDIEQTMNFLYQGFQEIGLKRDLCRTECMMWKWNGNRDDTSLASTRDFQHVELVNNKYIKHLCLLNNYNNFSIGNKQIEQAKFG